MFSEAHKITKKNPDIRCNLCAILGPTTILQSKPLPSVSHIHILFSCTWRAVFLKPQSTSIIKGVVRKKPPTNDLFSLHPSVETHSSLYPLLLQRDAGYGLRKKTTFFGSFVLALEKRRTKASDVSGNVSKKNGIMGTVCVSKEYEGTIYISWGNKSWLCPHWMYQNVNCKYEWAYHFFCRGRGPPVRFPFNPFQSNGGVIIDYINLFSGWWRTFFFDISMLSRGQINSQPNPIFILGLAPTGRLRVLVQVLVV